MFKQTAASYLKESFGVALLLGSGRLEPGLFCLNRVAKRPAVPFTRAKLMMDGWSKAAPLGDC
jgi:hypothetical protein